MDGIFLFHLPQQNFSLRYCPILGKIYWSLYRSNLTISPHKNFIKIFLYFIPPPPTALSPFNLFSYFPVEKCRKEKKFPALVHIEF